MKFLTYTQKLSIPVDKKLNFYNQLIKNPMYVFCQITKIALDIFLRMLYESMIFRKESNLPISKLDLNNIESISIYLNILIKEYESFRRLNLYKYSTNFFSIALQQFYEPNLNIFKSKFDSNFNSNLNLKSYYDLLNPLITFNKFIYIKYTNETDFQANIYNIYIPYFL